MILFNFFKKITLNVRVACRYHVRVACRYHENVSISEQYSKATVQNRFRISKTEVHLKSCETSFLEQLMIDVWQGPKHASVIYILELYHDKLP